MSSAHAHHQGQNSGPGGDDLHAGHRTAEVSAAHQHGGEPAVGHTHPGHPADIDGRNSHLISVPLAAGVLASVGFVLPMAVGAILMSLSTIVVAVNAQFFRCLDLSPEASTRAVLQRSGERAEEPVR